MVRGAESRHGDGDWLPESILQRRTRTMDVNEINSELVTVAPS